MNKDIKKAEYDSPIIEVIKIEVEEVIAQSAIIPDGSWNPGGQIEP